MMEPKALLWLVTVVNGERFEQYGVVRPDAGSAIAVVHERIVKGRAGVLNGEITKCELQARIHILD